MTDRTGGIQKIGVQNKPALRWLKGCVRGAAFPEVGGLDGYNPGPRSWQFCHGLVLEEFAEQFPYFLLRGQQGSLPGRSGSIHAANFPSKVVLLGMEEPVFFEHVEHRVKRPGAEFIAMSRELFDHPQAEDSFFRCVVKNMEAYEARIHLPRVDDFLFGGCQYRIPLSDSRTAYKCLPHAVVRML